MRVLVCPHDLAIGGSQINAIDLAAGAAAAGHDVFIYGIPGPLTAYIAEKGLRFLPANPMWCRPAPARIAEVAAICKRERIDLVHAYEWPTCLEAYYGALLFYKVPLLCTVLSMEVMPHVPPSVPLVVGTADIGDDARRTRNRHVWVIEPPIDVENDNPQIDGSGYRRRLGVEPHDLLVVSVSRLALDLKLDALVRAIDAADLLADSCPLKLALVGDGPARDALKARALAVNKRHGRDVVILPGAELDPRAAYAAADLVVGMGSSALRALAIGRPLIVQGERAFSEIFEPDTYDIFLRQGFYGLSDGAAGASRLATQMRELLDDPARRADLALFGRKAVVERFGLQRALELQLEIYRKVAISPPNYRLSEALNSARLSLLLEYANHDPIGKRRKRKREVAMLHSAGFGTWPPAHSV
ncbi:glycosyltransferase involved in cell wall biosynthesis [Pararhizobium capsulatum DSM 1112]|uniref:Glycosyltransferase involved in cell wall biosynthesis n=1 Tax=Pararhizobium capsulatum DSM 1112 TaxID=1121113 RepID=A0ABU0BVB5_9HYPH|nr:glycosyltransferase family 4 protein [Pararhizobium capsulatum]MDQ0322183.1 glycosyltransferase involved in cell wall biosynthesis [Pararhizobium capsulatum DSM 1112]